MHLEKSRKGAVNHPPANANIVRIFEHANFCDRPLLHWYREMTDGSHKTKLSCHDNMDIKHPPPDHFSVECPLLTTTMPPHHCSCCLL